MRPSCPPHHYVIATPNGVTSRGVCRKCHAVRHYPNAGPTGPWQIEDGRRAKDTVLAEEAV
ncbi:hypothetical protein LCGC14_0444850 [marine sediment metagenome]|uniref:Uncharacterized protein n=1 Tax=marine sediment metagenome TaxID=412755 RepID=A0A0F9VTD2_9ZZZZ